MLVENYFFVEWTLSKSLFSNPADACRSNPHFRSSHSCTTLHAIIASGVQWADLFCAQRHSCARMDSKEKKTMGCLPTKDGRVHFTMQVAATLSVGKTAYVCAFLCALTAFILAPFLGWARDAAMQRRVQKLEEALGKRLTWVSAHQSHLKKHLLQRSFSDASLNTDSSLQTDGRRHLWVEPGSYSKLAQALQGAGIDTTLPLTDDHYMCGEQEVTEDQVLRKTLALAAITWKAPLSLRNSMLSWQKSGLLDIIDERMLFINSASQEDFDIAKEFDFDVYTTEERNGNIMAGPALGYLVGNTTADYVLVSMRLG